jgi:hypothetical protein
VVALRSRVPFVPCCKTSSGNRPLGKANFRLAHKIRRRQTAPPWQRWAFREWRKRGGRTWQPRWHLSGRRINPDGLTKFAPFGYFLREILPEVPYRTARCCTSDLRPPCPATRCRDRPKNQRLSRAQGREPYERPALEGRTVDPRRSTARRGGRRGRRAPQLRAISRRLTFSAFQISMHMRSSCCSCS